MGCVRCFLIFQTVFFLPALLITETIAEELHSLKIFPSNHGVLTKKVGETFILGCKSNVPDPRLITQMEWRDPKDRLIESHNKNNSIFIVTNRFDENGIVLQFSSLNENHAGQYTCTATYANTERLKASVNVATFDDIEFVDAPLFQHTIAGKSYMIKCKVEGKPSPTVDWVRNGKVLTTEDRFVLQSEGLLVRDIQIADDGDYECRAMVWSTGNIKSRVIKLEVLVPPAIQPMDDVYVVEGESEVVRCVASGKPPPTYTWIKESTSQDLSITDRFGVKPQTGELFINRVAFDDSSLYKCVAENRGGNAEISVRINVLVKPRIYELLNVTTHVGGTAQLVCKAQGTPIPHLILRKIGTSTTFDGDERTSVDQLDYADKHEAFAVMNITNVTRSDDGLYECVAENRVATAYKNGHIAVEFAPTFERTKNYSLMVWSWHQRPGNLTCLPEAIPNATVVWKYRGIEIRNSRNFNITRNGPMSNLIVIPQNDYNFYTNYECVATNRHGTASLMIKLNKGEIPSEVQQVLVQTLTATSIRFDIQPPTYFDSLPIRTIIVQFKEERHISWDYAYNYTWSFNALYILENLQPEVTYNFRFAASNDVGVGAFRNAQTVTMPRRSEPAEPKIFLPQISDNGGNGGGDLPSSTGDDIVSVSPYADHFELHWNVPNDNGEPIDGYLIKYCMTEKINGEWRDSDCGEEIQQSFEYTTYELSPLLADTTYRVELRAHNAIGSSAPAQIRIRTARGMDSAIPFTEPAVSSGAIIGIVIAIVLLVLLVVDVACFCVNRAGILAFCCNCNTVKHTEEDPKLSRDEREPLHQSIGQQQQPLGGNICGPKTPVNNGAIIEKQMTVEYDGNHVYSRPGEYTGKHSIV